MKNGRSGYERDRYKACRPTERYGLSALVLHVVAALTSLITSTCTSSAQVVEVYCERTIDIGVETRKGMGLLLRDNQVLTAAHTLREGSHAWIECEGLVGPAADIADVLYSDQANELVLARLARPIATHSQAHIGPWAAKPGERALYYVSTPREPAAEQRVGRYARRMDVLGHPYYVAAVSAAPGESGAPWFDLNGTCGAITVYGDDERTWASGLAGIPRHCDLREPVPFEEWASSQDESNSLHELGQLQVAIDSAQSSRITNALKAAQQRYPGNWFVQYACAKEWARLDVTDQTLATLRGMKQLCPQEFVTADLAMMAWLRNGCPVEATEYLRLAVETYDGVHSRVDRIATAAYELGLTEIASTWSEAWIRLDPFGFDSRFLRARVLFSAEQYSLAYPLFEEVNQEAVRSDILCGYLGACAFHMQQYELAAEWYTAAVEFAPGYVDYQYRLGNAKWRNRDYDGALMAFRRVQELAPTEASGYVAHAEVLMDTNAPDAAIALLIRHLEIVERSQAGRDVLSILVSEAGKEHALADVVRKWSRRGQLSEEVSEYVRELLGT